MSNIVLKSLQRCPALCFNSKLVKNLEEWQNDSGLKHCILKTAGFFFFLWGIIWHLDWQGEEILIYTDVKQREENCSKTKKNKNKKIQQRKPSVTCKKGAICSSACRAHSGHLCPGPHSLRDQSQYSYENWAKKKKKKGEIWSILPWKNYYYCLLSHITQERFWQAPETMLDSFFQHILEPKHSMLQALLKCSPFVLPRIAWPKAQPREWVAQVNSCHLSSEPCAVFKTRTPRVSHWHGNHSKNAAPKVSW